MSITLRQQGETSDRPQVDGPTPQFLFSRITTRMPCFQGKACHPLLIRRWRSGKVIWEGKPGAVRILHRGYPLEWIFKSAKFGKKQK